MLRSQTRTARSRIALLLALLAVINGVVWLVLFAAARHYALLLPLGVTAYLLGLRHAVDPDHIAAIDGTTRKLLHDRSPAESVGFYFSVGHSTIVIILSVLVAFFGVMLKARFPALASSGTIVGTWVSVSFLVAIAAANLAVLFDLLRGKSSAAHAGETLSGGILSRVLRPALRMVRRSEHMYAVGLLFGLGFDTATEVALLGISAVSGAGGMPLVYILVLPALFTAGMSLIDTVEGVAMLGVYGWAFTRPSLKLRYNINVTVLTVLLALVVGGAEAAAALR
jgi:nickel/cobalt transporter (NiCoT) family protein